MAKKVLIVDDDQEMLRILKKDLGKYSRTFTVLTAEDGLAAVEMLKKNNISLIITDLELPQMDGIALLSHLRERYPDISAIVITDSSTPEKQKLAKEKGAAGYVEKPFIIEDLTRKIITSLKKEGDGGILHGIAPGTFLQLVEMEEKTCTIRLTDDKSGNQGVLFFKDGELLEARINELQGRDAAYQILAWEEATLSIQESCALTENKVQADLQALLLEAMRLKDEIKEQTEQEGIIEVEEQEIQVEPELKTTPTTEGEITRDKKPEIILELEDEKPAPGTTTEVKKTSPTVTVGTKKETSKETEIRAQSHTAQVPDSEDEGIVYSIGDNIFSALSDLKESILGSSFVKLIFKALVLFVILVFLGFSYFYITLESDRDLMKQIGQTKAHIRSQQEARFQIEEEIQRLYTEKEQSFKNNESKIVLLELDLKIAELEEKQEKIETETKSWKKDLEACQVKLETMKRKTFLERITERIKDYISQKAA